MTANEIIALAQRFICKDTPKSVDVDVELAGDAMRMWPRRPTTIDLAAVAEDVGILVEELPRHAPLAPRRVRYARILGVTILHLAGDQLVCVEAHRVPVTSLAGGFTTTNHVMALFRLVDGELTTENVERHIGRLRARPRKDRGPMALPSAEDWSIPLVPRIGSNIERAALETSDGVHTGLQIDLAQPIFIDLEAFGRVIGATAKPRYYGHPPAMRVSHSYDPEGTAHNTSISLTAPASGMTQISSLLARRHAETSAPPLAPPSPRPPSLPAAPLLAQIDAFFATLDGPAMIDVAGTFDAASLEAQLGPSLPVSPAVAYPPPFPPDAARFSIRRATACGFVLVEPFHTTLYRQAPDAWLGDFARPDDILALIELYLDTPRLPIAAALAALGDALPERKISDTQIDVHVRPYAGSNLTQVRISMSPARLVDRIEIELLRPMEIDFATLQIRAPVVRDRDRSGMNRRIGLYQHFQRTTTGTVVLSAFDDREGPVQLLRSMILYRP